MKNQTVTGEYSGNGHEEVALDQAANEHAGAVVGAVKPSVADRLKQAKAIVTDALCHNPRHDESCAALSFALKNRCLPANHPTWKHAPACNCWVGRLAEWLKNNSEI